MRRREIINIGVEINEKDKKKKKKKKEKISKTKSWFFGKKKDNFLNACIIFCVNVYFQGIRAIKYI